MRIDEFKFKRFFMRCQVDVAIAITKKFIYNKTCKKYNISKYSTKKYKVMINKYLLDKVQERNE